MSCKICDDLEQVFLKSIVYADQAETSLRCYLITHQRSTGVSDMDEYESLRAEQRRTADERDRAYMGLVTHRRSHGN